MKINLKIFLCFSLIFTTFARSLDSNVNDSTHDKIRRISGFVDFNIQEISTTLNSTLYDYDDSPCKVVIKRIKIPSRMQNIHKKLKHIHLDSISIHSIDVEICVNLQKPCLGDLSDFACVQKFSKITLRSSDFSNTNEITNDVFLLPSGCSCEINQNISGLNYSNNRKNQNE